MPISMDHAHGLLLSLPAEHLPGPADQLVTPASPNQDAADDIDRAEHQRHETSSLLSYGQEDGFDVEFEEDTWDRMVIDLVRLRGHGVLIGEDGGGAWVRGFGVGRSGVDGRHNREVILVFPKIRVGDGVGSVERVLEGRVERSEGQLIDDVREIKHWTW